MIGSSKHQAIKFTATICYGKGRAKTMNIGSELDPVTELMTFYQIISLGDYAASQCPKLRALQLSDSDTIKTISFILLVVDAHKPSDVFYITEPLIDNPQPTSYCGHTSKGF